MQRSSNRIANQAQETKERPQRAEGERRQQSSKSSPEKWSSNLMNLECARAAISERPATSVLTAFGIGVGVGVGLGLLFSGRPAMDSMFRDKFANFVSEYMPRMRS